MTDQTPDLATLGEVIAELHDALRDALTRAEAWDTLLEALALPEDATVDDVLARLAS